MKTNIILLTFIISFCTQAFAQTGGDLHVKGKIRSDSLANQNYLLIYADSTGTLDTLEPGAAGQVLISKGTSGKPYWSDLNISACDSVLYYNLTSVGTDANTTEKVLASYTLPANTLDADNIGIEITIFGTYSANSNNKTINLKFGGNNIFSLPGAFSGFYFIGKINIYRANSTTSKAIGKLHVGTFSISTWSPRIFVINTINFNSNIFIEFTGQNSVASANDIVLEGIIIQLIK